MPRRYGFVGIERLNRFACDHDGAVAGGCALKCRCRNMPMEARVKEGEESAMAREMHVMYGFDTRNNKL